MGVCASAPDEVVATTTSPPINDLYATPMPAKSLRTMSANTVAQHLTPAPVKPRRTQTATISHNNSTATWQGDARSVTLRNSSVNNSTAAGASNATHDDRSQCVSPASVAPVPLQQFPALFPPLDAEVEVHVVTTQFSLPRRTVEQSSLVHHCSAGELRDGDASLTLCSDQQLYLELQASSATTATPNHNGTSHHRANHVVHVQGDQCSARRLAQMNSTTASASALNSSFCSADDVQNPLALPRLSSLGGWNARSTRYTPTSSTSGASLNGFMHMRDPSDDNLVVEQDAAIQLPETLTSLMSPKSDAAAPGAALRPTGNAAGFSLDSHAFMKVGNAFSASMASSRGFGISEPFVAHSGEDAEWHLPHFCHS
jgi:hypothetical protein